MAKRDPDQALFDSLRHPLRRRLPRHYIEAPGMLSPKELARVEERPLSNISFHARQLAEHGALEVAGERRVRGAVDHFYRATQRVKYTPWVLGTFDLGD
jgi:hypothetical protein